MMHDLEILSQNKDFLLNAYGLGNLNGIMGLLILVSLVDLALKGWALWRAARMSKRSWFIALLLVNSMGILPTIFLLVTNGEYVAKNSAIRR